jgi:hypothetical protein
MTSTVVHSELGRQILGLERKRVEAMIAEDIPALSALLADDLTYTHSGGRIDSKESFLALIAAPASHYLGVDYSDDTETIVCGESVIVRGVAALRLSREGESEETRYSVIFVDVWMNRGDGWQMVAWQATRLPDAA